MREHSALVLASLQKRYGRREVLRGVSLDVPHGEFFGLIGMNGAGKSTCLKAILDFHQIDAGSIQIYGVPHRETRARARIAYLPERFTPPYYLTGMDFLQYVARLEGRKLRVDSVHAMCEALDLSLEALARRVREFSKGMSQKLGLVAAFLSGKDMLILDEPMSGLDPKARLLTKAVMMAQRKAGTGVFFSTHMLSDVEELCDRIGVMHEGQLRFVGTPEECCSKFASPNLEQAYLACISTE